MFCGQFGLAKNLIMALNRVVLLACQIALLIGLASVVVADNAVVGVGGFVRVSPELSKYVYNVFVHGIYGQQVFVWKT